MNRIYFFYILLISIFLLQACQDDDLGPDGTGTGRDLTDVSYEPVDYNLEVPCSYPEMDIPADNPLTVQGVELGRFLFYDTILSADSTQSCSSCHAPNGSFTDNLAVSVGIDGNAGRRSSMSLLNVGYFYTGLFWDGRVTTLEEQALVPVEDPIELHNTWPELEKKMRSHDLYPAMFRKAFGISNTDEISKEYAAKAIAQFERTLVSSGDSKFDQERCTPGFFFNPLELEGSELFAFEDNDHPGCTHCHKKGLYLFTDNTYKNNGIEDVGTEVDDLNDFPDKGRGEVTGDLFDNGKFRVPSLLNIAHTAPYMHDGRFETLDKVLDHYSTGGFNSANIDPNVQPFPLNANDRAALLAFMNTLTDTTFMNNPAHQSPF